MRISRSRHAQQFVTIPNELARNSALSFRARGLLVMLLSLPDGWHVTTTMLGEENPEGRDAIRKALRELQGAGYAKVLNRQDGRGRWSRWVEVYDSPQGGTGAVLATDRSLKSRPRADQREHEFPQVAPKTGIPNFGESVQKLNTVTKNGMKTGGSTAVERGGLPAGSRGKPRERAQPAEEQIIAVTRMAIAEVYGDRENVVTEDEEVLDLYGCYVSDRNPPHPRAYLKKIFGDAPDLQTLIMNSFSSEQAADGLDAIRYGRCPDCREPFSEQGYPQADGRCGTCSREAG